MGIEKNINKKRHRLSNFKLEKLLEITHAINSNFEVAALFDLYQDILETHLGIEKLVLYGYNSNWHAMHFFGIEGQPEDIEDSSIFDIKNTGTFSLSASGRQEAFDIVIPVLNEEVPIAFILVGDVEEDKRGMSPVIKHMRYIQTITNIILVAIQNKRLAEENLRQVRISKELELAAEMQSMLVPAGLPQDENYDVSAIYKPHLQVGGDYYDFIELEDGRVMCCMADVSGKGVSAAFLMANFQAYLMGIFKYLDLQLPDVVNNLNERVMVSAMGEKYITLFIATFDPKTRELRYINCGHNPPILIHPDGSNELLSLGSIGLGMFDEIPTIKEGVLTLDKNSVVICYTDGLVEQENASNEEFGVDKLASIGGENVTDNSEELNAKILTAFNEFRGDTPFIDDTALLTCKFH